MSGDVIKEFLVGLGFDIQGEAAFTDAIGKATMAAVGLGTAAVAAASGLFVLAKATADYYDNLGDMSNRTGIAVGEIEEFGYVAQLTGSSFETASASMESFSKAAGDAANGMGRGQKVFEQLGISVEDSNGKLKDTTDLLFEVGDKVKDMEKGKQTAIFARLGIDRTLVDALTTDVSGLRAEFKALYDGAGLDSQKAAEKSGKFMDALDRFNFVITTVGRSLAVNFMDRFTEALDSLRKLIVDNLPAIMRAVKPVITLILDLADVFIALAYRAGQAVGFVIGVIADVVGSLNGWVVAIGLVAAAWKYLNLAFLASPVGLILAAVVAFGLLIDDFMTWKEGGESLVPWGDWADEINVIAETFEGFLQIGKNVLTTLWGLVDAIVKLFSGDFEGALGSLQIAFGALADSFYILFGSAFEFIKSSAAAAFEYIQGVLASAVEYLTTSVGGLGTSISTVLDSIGEKFTSVFTGIKDFVGGVVTYISDIIASIGGSLDGVVGKVKGAVDWVKGAAEGAAGIFGSPETAPTTQKNADGSISTALPLPAQPGPSPSSPQTIPGTSMLPMAAQPQPTAVGLMPSPVKLGVDGGMQTSLPQPANQSITQETTINVQGGANPASTAKEVAGQQGQVNGDMVRNMKGAVR